MTNVKFSPRQLAVLNQDPPPKDLFSQAHAVASKVPPHAWKTDPFPGDPFAADLPGYKAYLPYVGGLGVAGFASVLFAGRHLVEGVLLGVAVGIGAAFFIRAQIKIERATVKLKAIGRDGGRYALIRALEARYDLEREEISHPFIVAMARKHAKLAANATPERNEALTQSGMPVVAGVAAGAIAAQLDDSLFEVPTEFPGWEPASGMQVNVDGTPMLGDTGIDINGNAFGVTDSMGSGLD